MKRIQTIADIEALKIQSNIAKSFLNVVELEFMNWFEAEGTEESLTSFRLPNHACIYYLEGERDTSFIANQSLFIEYVEKEVTDDCTYFRIGIMNDHEMSVIFFVEGMLDEQFEQSLQERSCD
ncbi:hypothetical protein [Bacillus seohaeanensis]|uniref:Uncharacterized protein n=1 Tax=Bacillus seohaeanensis TaxID=284580 RepID=A0ABW5RLU4_9BACI